jgi:serine phosphatase RsbU (regulator of sigma subunit)/tetratricopeptide (TPR) repeat protein
LRSILIILAIFLVSGQALIAQQDTIDTYINSLPEDSLKIQKLQEYALSYEYTNPERAKNFLDEALQLSEKLDNSRGIVLCLIYLGYLEEDAGFFDNAIQLYKQAQDSAHLFNLPADVSNSLKNIGNVYTSLSNYPLAINYFQQALHIADSINHTLLISGCINNIGIVHRHLKNYKQAQEYFEKGMKLNEESGNKSGVLSNLINLGNIQYNLQNYSEAIPYYEKGLDIANELDNPRDRAMCLDNLGIMYYSLKDYQLAIDYYEQTLAIRREINDVIGISSTLINLAAFNNQIGNYKKATELLYESLAISKSIGAMLKMRDGYKNMADTYSKMEQFDSAYHYHVKYNVIKDSIFNLQRSEQIEDLERKYQLEKKEQQIQRQQDSIEKVNKQKIIAELKEKEALADKIIAENIAEEATEQTEIEKEKSKAERIEKESEKKQKWFLASGFLLLLGVVFFVFRTYQEKKKANSQLSEKNAELTQQKEEILSQSELLTEINDELQNKNRQITDSIHYAKLIQQAILPDIEKFKSKTGLEAFVFYQPRDIVSGDFYWFANHKNHIFIATADCTGHGVPGAFLSMIGTTLLSETIIQNEITDPAEILTKVNKSLVELIGRKNESEIYDDGMDISIACINKNSQELKISMANQFAFLVEQDNVNLIEGDIYALGSLFSRQNITFTNHIFNLNKGSRLYLLSDGFIDQFGGDESKKYNRKSFEILLQDLSQKPFQNHSNIIKGTFLNWKGDNKQIDDVLVLGIQF